MSRQEERRDDGNACDDSTDGECSVCLFVMVSIPKW
jgi:hypothetical protein